MRLARRQLRRRPVRNSLTIGVVYIALAMGIGLGTTIRNNVDNVRLWYRRTLVGDFFLRASFVDTAAGQAVELPLSLGDDIRRIPGVTNVDTMRYFHASVAGQQGARRRPRLHRRGRAGVSLRRRSAADAAATGGRRSGDRHRAGAARRAWARRRDCHRRPTAASASPAWRSITSWAD